MKPLAGVEGSYGDDTTRNREGLFEVGTPRYDYYVWSLEASLQLGVKGIERRLRDSFSVLPLLHANGMHRRQNPLSRV